MEGTEVSKGPRVWPMLLHEQGLGFFCRKQIVAGSPPVPVEASAKERLVKFCGEVFEGLDRVGPHRRVKLPTYPRIAHLHLSSREDLLTEIYRDQREHLLRRVRGHLSVIPLRNSTRPRCAWLSQLT